MKIVSRKGIISISLLFLILVIVGLRIHDIFNYPPDFDEIEGIHAGWLISQGEIPYKDFFQHHTPLSYYLLYPVFIVSNEPHMWMLLGRCISFAFYLMILLVLYFLAKKVLNKELALASVLLFASGTRLHFVGSLMILRDMSSILFLMLGIYIFTLGFQKNKYFLLSGVVISLSVLCKQIVIYWAVALIIAMLMLKLNKSISLFVLGGVSVYCITLSCFYLMGGLGDFLYYTMAFNKILYKSIGASMITNIQSFVAYLFNSPIVWGFGLMGIVANIKKRDPIELTLVLSVVIPLFILLSVAPICSPRYFLYLFPILSIYSLRIFKSNHLPYLLCAFIIIGGIVPILVAYHENYIEHNPKIYLDNTISLMNYVNNITSPDERIFGYFIPISRHPSDWRWQINNYDSDESADYSIEYMIDNNVRVVVLPWFTEISNERLNRFIENNYVENKSVLVKPDKRIRVLIRKPITSPQNVSFESNF